MKRNNAIDFLTVTLFFGIMLSFMIYLGIDTLVQYEPMTKDDTSGGFNSMFYNDDNMDSFVKSFDYKVFGQTGASELIVGKDDWLFEAKDVQSGYERLLDYIGGCQFDGQQLEAIDKKISSDKSYFEQKGADYLLVVIPDSITVCSDKVPSYLGYQSENTRRAQVAAYLSGASADCYIDPTAQMIDANKTLSAYNNTENSINAYGAYVIYGSVMDRLGGYEDSGVSKISENEVEFFTRLTDGRSIALRAGLDKTIKNRTVSLTDKMEYSYEVVSSGKSTTLTRMDNATNNVRIIVECNEDWDRTLLMPYFSNTFYEVIYTSNAAATRIAIEKNDVAIVVRLIHEGELDSLIR